MVQCSEIVKNLLPLFQFTVFLYKTNTLKPDLFLFCKVMDIHYIRSNPDNVRNNQIARYKDPSIVDMILQLDEKWKNRKWKQDNLRKLKNKLSKKFVNAPSNISLLWDDEQYTIDKMIDDLMHERVDGNKFTRDQLKLLVNYVSDMIAKGSSKEESENELNDILLKRDKLISELGNQLHFECIIDDNEENNGLIFTNISQADSPTTSPKTLLDHIDLLEKLGFVDTENGIKVAGNRGYFLTGFGVKLNQAIMNYALDFIELKNFKLMETPHFVTKDLMSQITQLSDYEDTLYKIEGYDKYLIATSEQPLTAFFNGKVIHDVPLPIRFAGLSSCYRKEAGAHARHTRGIYRVHQFQKVEQFCVTEPDKSWDMFKELINNCKEFYESLGIKFRIVNIVSGALNNAASMKYDLEAYFPGSNEWCELVSCTNVLDYFSKRIGLKGAKGEFLHMLNSTLCANTRTLCALVETHQTKDGFIVPEVLKQYVGGKAFVTFQK
jgi:seryl-tRNA synthetase